LQICGILKSVPQGKPLRKYFDSLFMAEGKVDKTSSASWEEYVHKGCWYWASSYSSIASKGYYWTITP